MQAQHEAPSRPAPGPGVDSCLRAVLGCAHEHLIDSPGLQPCPIEADLADARGHMAGRALRLRTRRFTGSGWESLTLAEMTDEHGQLQTLTVIGLPAHTSALPILGVDLIGLRGSLSLIALDLSPTDAQLFTAVWAPLLGELHAQLQALPGDPVVPRKRPDFAAHSFSPLALIAGVRSGAEQVVIPPLCRFVQHLGARLGRLGATAGCALDPERASQATERAQSWRVAERQNRREQSALAAIFGAEFARRYLDGFLFGA